MTTALLSPHATALLLGANLAALTFILVALTIIADLLTGIRNHLAFLGGVNSEVLRAWTVAQSETCSDEVEQQELEGRAA